MEDIHENVVKFAMDKDINIVEEDIENFYARLLWFE